MSAHLLQRGAVYYWRRRLPHPVARAWGRTHISLSLGVYCKISALHLAAVLDGYAARLFTQLSRQMTASPNLDRLRTVRASFADLLGTARSELRSILDSNDDALRQYGQAGGLSPTQHAALLDTVLENEKMTCQDLRIRVFMTGRSSEDLAQAEDRLLEGLREALAIGDATLGQATLHRALAQTGLVIDQDAEYLRLALDCVRLRIRAIDMERADRGYEAPSGAPARCWAPKELQHQGDSRGLSPASAPQPPAAHPMPTAHAPAVENKPAQPNAPDSTAAPDSLTEVPAPENDATRVDAPSHPPKGEAAMPQSHEQERLLSEEFVDYCRAKSITDWANAKDGRSKSILDAKFACRLFIELVGNIPVSAIRKDEAVTFKFRLCELPYLHGKSIYKGMSADEAIATHQETCAARAEGEDLSHLKIKSLDAVLKTLSAKTINKHLSTMVNFMTWKFDHSEVERKNPFSGLLFDKKNLPKSATFKRRPWTLDEIHILFRSPAWTGHGETRLVPGPTITKDAFYWAPLISALSGLRLEEALQMSTDDIRCKEGIWYFDIKEGPGQVLKSAAAIREIPIHSHLIALGLLDHFNAMKKRKERWLFPDAAPSGPAGRRGASATKQFGSYRAALGLIDRGADFHAWRMTFNSDLADSDVETNVRSRLLGHEIKDLADTIYREKFKLPNLQRAVEKLGYVAHLPQP